MIAISSAQKAGKIIGFFAAILIVLFINNTFARDNDDRDSDDRDSEIRFELTDNAGRWFDTGAELEGNRSITVATPGVRVKFSGD